MNLGRVRITIQKGISCFADKEGEVVELKSDHHGEFAMVVFDDDPRPIRFGVGTFVYVKERESHVEQNVG